MNTWSIAVDNNSFEGAGITKDCQNAVCVFIWNGYEAQAKEIFVSFEGVDMQEAPYLRIDDNGVGICHSTLHTTFGSFLSSQKKHKRIRIKSQTNKGKGRFSYTAFSHSATWNTVYCEGGKKYEYSIVLDSTNKAIVQESDVVEIESSAKTIGTSVTIPLSDAKIHDLLSFAKMRNKLLEEFAWYLYLNKDAGIKLNYAGNDVDYNEYIDADLSRHETVQIQNHAFLIDVVVWKSRIENTSKIYYINNTNEITDAENTSFNKNAVNFFHGVFVKSDYFSEIPTLIGSDDESIVEYADGQKTIMRAVKNMFVKCSNVLCVTF